MFNLLTALFSRRLLVVSLSLFCVTASPLLADDIDFERDILPIFQESCLECHGPDEQESAFRVDSRVALLKGGDYGEPAIVPGDSAKGLLIQAITYEDSSLEMPPDEKLDDEKIELLKRWVQQGAVWPGQMDQEVVYEKSDHWSFQPIVRPDVPAIGNNDQPANSRRGKLAGELASPIDAFLLDRLAKDGLEYSAPADARSLMRRAAIVLTGLPPTSEQYEEFAKAFELDSETAYAELVDELLASPHFGERWAQHWLDVIRWAETNGSESNSYRKNSWIYRDYVIRSFNQDKPYDQFIFEQIAGDAADAGDATGYLVSGPHVPLATVGREETARRQARADRLDEILQTVGASAMGMTIGCARCHNHKFDPISIKDYYSMTAVFQDVEFGSRFPELGDDHPRRIRGKELYGQINQQRRKLREMGLWEEDWIGYKEFHFPATTTQSVRISFKPGGVVRIDELEVMGTKEFNKNLALDSAGTEIDSSKDGTTDGNPLSKINDGEYGNDSWIVRRAKNKKEMPWVQFTFEEPHEINRLRLSTNREDFLETDYLQGLNSHQFEVTKVEVQSDDGEWTEVADRKQLGALNKEHQDRAAIVAKLQELIELTNEEGPKPSFVGRRIKPVNSFVFSRGSPENPADEVFAAGLRELDGDLGLKPNASGKMRRQAFAQWIIAAENPLTARVAANRIWHHVFGQGIVTTTSDFGAAGAPPTHPELLDWLATEIMQPSAGSNQTEPTALAAGTIGSESSAQATGQSQPWSMKHLIRMMVMSEAFRQSSLPRTEALKIDAGSALLWRFPPKRLEAEVIRDAILQASGVLEPTVGGRSFRIHNVKKRYAQWEVEDNHGSETWRRMIYQERMRRVDDQMFTAFDFPDCGQVRAKRPVSTTPLQALNLLNSEFVMEQSAMIAHRAEADCDGDLSLAICRCFELLLLRQPAAEELEACLELAQDTDLSLVCRTLMNTNEFAFLP